MWWLFKKSKYKKVLDIESSINYTDAKYSFTYIISLYESKNSKKMKLSLSNNYSVHKSTVKDTLLYQKAFSWANTDYSIEYLLRSIKENYKYRHFIYPVSDEAKNAYYKIYNKNNIIKLVNSN